MIKKNKRKLILSSIVILLPVIAGLILWDELPMQMATHWNINGSADRWGSRYFAVFAIPVFMLVIHWICFIATSFDSKNQTQSKKAFGLIFWICPFISLLASAIIYAAAFGMELGINAVVFASMGLMFVIIGNYLPKCKQNRTLGIRIKWTLENEENWNATHRFGGRVWVIGGLLLIACSFLIKAEHAYTALIILILIVIIPIIYSYMYYHKQKKCPAEDM